MSYILHLFLLGSIVFGVGGEPPAVQLPQYDGFVVAYVDDSCGSYYVPPDELYTSAVGWQYGGLVSNSGTFATFYDLPEGKVCAVVLDLTQTGNHASQLCDVFVWEDDEGVPGAVISGAIGADVGPTAFWPSVSRHFVSVNACNQGKTWVGYRGQWEGQAIPYYVAADAESSDRGSLTNVAPGLGYPTGWQSTSVVWEQAASLGVGVIVEEDGCPSPNVSTTWGRLKRTYR